jgi:hypothetical protein
MSQGRHGRAIFQIQVDRVPGLNQALFCIYF